MSELVWLYAVAAAAPGPLEGIESRPVRAIDEGGLVAIVSDVPADEYEQAVLDEKVRDGDWLTPRATAHQAVNAALLAGVDALLPVPFGTIYRTDERVREMLRTRAEELRAKLAALRGASEFVLALYRDTVQAASHLLSVRASMEPVAAGSGRRYLEEKKAEGERRLELRRLDEEAALAARHAIERVTKRGFDEPIADPATDLIARTTYVVRRDDEHRLHDAIGGFNSDWRMRGYELRATGPWPPYRSAA